MFWRQVLASESGGSDEDRDAGHRNHFRLLAQGQSWSGREPNVLFQNRGDGTYDEVAGVLGLDLHLDSRGAAAADLDGDGDLDLVVYNRNAPTVKVYRNDTPGQGRSLLIDLRGSGLNTAAVGAQVETRCDGLQSLRQVSAGSGFISQSPPTLHFGLAACASADLEIYWPSGARQSVPGVPADHRVIITEASSEAEVIPLVDRNSNVGDLAKVPGALSAPAPDLGLPLLDGSGTLDVADAARGTLVLNFWATWCVSCIAEMPELEALHQEFGPRGVKFVGVVMDEADKAAAVKKFLDDRGVSYEQVWGDLAAQTPFSTLASTPPGSIPTTAVLHHGIIREVHVGPIVASAFAELLSGILASE